MKSTLIFLLSMIIAGTANAQTKTDWDGRQLKGKVKSLQTKETHRYKKNGVFTEWEKSYGRLIKFNDAGYMTEFTEFSGNDSLSYKITYAYNLKEKKADVSYFNKEMKPTIKKNYKYDDKGRKIEEQEFDVNGQPDRRYTYSYDDRGNLTEIISYKKDGTVSNKRSYQYDSKNNRTEWKLETPGYATSSTKFAYDDKGNMIEESWYDGKGAITFRFVSSYDANGNKIQELKYKSGDKLVDTVKWSYEYDKKGNWIKKVDLTSDGIDFHTEVRTINYH